MLTLDNPHDIIMLTEKPNKKLEKPIPKRLPINHGTGTNQKER